MAATAFSLLNSLEVHPSGSPDAFPMAKVMIALAVVTAVPVAWVARKVVAGPGTNVETLAQAIEANA